MTLTLDAPPLVDGDELRGSTTPRLFTPPLVQGPPGPCGCGCSLTPETSAGFEAAAFATAVLGVGLYPWQRWWLIHALELRPNGQFRFRTVVTLISRQNGKTHLLKIVSLWAMFTGRVRMVLGAAQSLDIARESWWGAVELARSVPELAAEIPEKGGVLNGNNERVLRLDSGARYRVAAATEGAGRGLSVDLLILDELRQHHDWSAWGALSKTTSARPNALTVGISNAGETKSVVLNSLRAAALAGADETLGLMEWSAPDGCALDDPDAWVASNPALGYGQVTEQSIRSAMATDPPAIFRTETLCQHVDNLDNALDMAAWADCADPSSDLEPLRERVCVCLDVAMDGAHATLAAAAPLDDGRVRVEVLAAWAPGPGLPTPTEQARRELGAILAQVQPADLGWFPDGPAAALGAELRGLRRTTARSVAERRGRRGDGSARVVTEDEHELTRLQGAMDREACQGLADLVLARRLLHPSDDLLDTQAAGAGKVNVGGGWKFARRGGAHVDGLYAVAGAVYLARMLPPPTPVPRSRAF